MKSIWVAAVTAAALMASCAGGSHGPAADSAEGPEQSGVSDLTSEAEAWADTVLAKMPLRHKVAQLFMPAVYSSADAATLAQAGGYAEVGMGGVVLLKGDTAGAAAVARAMARGQKVPPWIAIDAEWGLAMRLHDAERLPRFAALGKTADDNAMYDYGQRLATQCRDLGINMVFGPVVDVSGAPGGFIGNRSLGSDSRRVATLATAYARGLEDGRVVSVAKHFPGHGSVTADSHQSLPSIDRSLRELDSIDLYPFKRYIGAGLSGVMVGHLAVPALDSRRMPAAVSPTVISDLLRSDLGFNGLVITDALGMKGAEGHSALEALAAGADIVLAPLDTQAEIDAVVRAICQNKISEALIDEKLRKSLVYKYLFVKSG